MVAVRNTSGMIISRRTRQPASVIQPKARSRDAFLIYHALLCFLQAGQPKSYLFFIVLVERRVWRVVALWWHAIARWEARQVGSFGFLTTCDGVSSK